VQQGQEPLAQLALLGLTEPQEQLVWELKAVQAQLALLAQMVRQD
jgi:hypothetical protein